MIRNPTLIGGTIYLVFGIFGAATAFAQAGPGASVEWKVGPGPVPTVFYDSPAGYDKHYRVCFKKFAETTEIEVVLSNRSVKIENEDCIDVMSNKISIQMLEGTETATGIFYLVE